MRPPPLLDDEGSSAYGPPFWVALAVGGAVMGFAVLGAFDAFSLDAFGRWGAWVIGLDLVNDFVVLPVVAVIGVGLARVPLGRARGPVQAGLFATAITLLIAYPGLTERSASDNPTIQPINYATATATVLLVVWAAAAAWWLVRRRTPTR